jgi:hypothetical protein
VAEEIAGEIASLPIEVAGLGDDLELARHGARFKATHKLSLADAFAAAPAKTGKPQLVTGGHAIARGGRYCLVCGTARFHNPDIDHSWNSRFRLSGLTQLSQGNFIDSSWSRNSPHSALLFS